jgi:hypothetical protein
MADYADPALTEGPQAAPPAPGGRDAGGRHDVGGGDKMGGVRHDDEEGQ